MRSLRFDFAYFLRLLIENRLVKPECALRAFRLRDSTFDFQFPGGLTARVTPVPIPNTEVKPRRADDTALETTRERRSPPGLKFKGRIRQKRMRPFLFLRPPSHSGILRATDMAKADKILDQILRGTSDANISFSSMLRLLAKDNVRYFSHI